jgi:CPA2 family monovalent cation:H+ antiporter-2
VAFSLKDLTRIGRVALYGTFLQVTLTILLGAAAFSLTDGSRFESIFIGCVLAASSSMVILKTLLDRGEAASGHGRLLLSMSIVQDLIVVLLIAVLPKFATNTSPDAGAIARDVALTLLKSALFIGAFLLIGPRVVPRLMMSATRLRSSEMFVVFAAVFALGSATVSGALGLSAALGAFVAGLVLSESEFDHRVIAEVVPLRDLFATLFFVSVGMLIDVHFVVQHWPAVLAFAIGAIILKALATLSGILPFQLTPRTAAFTALGMVPIGELNFVLAQSGLRVNALSLDNYKTILAAALLTILITPLLFRAAVPLSALFARSNTWKRFFDSHSNIGSESTLEAHAVVIGYGRVGQVLARGLRAAGMQVVTIDARLTRVRQGIADGFTAVYGHASAATVLGAAGIERARLVIVALPDHDASLLSVRQIRQANKHAVIAARAEYAASESTLKDAGADLVVLPELEGATALLHGTLDLLGMPR